MAENDPMPRVPGVKYEPQEYHDIVDFIADYCHDAIDAGMWPEEVISGLQDVEAEIKSDYIEKR